MSPPDIQFRQPVTSGLAGTDPTGKDLQTHEEVRQSRRHRRRQRKPRRARGHDFSPCATEAITHGLSSATTASPAQEQPASSAPETDRDDDAVRALVDRPGNIDEICAGDVLCVG